MNNVVKSCTKQPFFLAFICAMLILYSNFLSVQLSGGLGKGGAGSVPSCLYEHMNYQERKGWLTLDSLKWRESQDESTTFRLTKLPCECVCMWLQGESFQYKILPLSFLFLFLLLSCVCSLQQIQLNHFDLLTQQPCFQQQQAAVFSAMINSRLFAKAEIFVVITSHKSYFHNMHSRKCQSIWCWFVLVK